MNRERLGRPRARKNNWRAESNARWMLRIYDPRRMPPQPSMPQAPTLPARESGISQDKAVSAETPITASPMPPSETAIVEHKGDTTTQDAGSKGVIKYEPKRVKNAMSIQPIDHEILARRLARSIDEQVRLERELDGYERRKNKGQLTKQDRGFARRYRIEIQEFERPKDNN